LLFGNTTNNVRIELEKGRVVIECSGNNLIGPQLGTLVWTREQELTVEVHVGKNGRKLSVSGAKEGNFEVSDAEDRPWPTNSDVHILGDPSGAQECADLRYIGFFAPNE
jgi:hypothetical protein